MKISELASMALCGVETIRYYEKAGLLPEPHRTVSNYRQYSAAHLDRLRFIRNCRALDMTQDEIRSLLKIVDQTGKDCVGINLIIDQHIEHVDSRVNELLNLKQQLLNLRMRCKENKAAASCEILKGLISMKAESKRQPTHLS